MKEIFEQGEFSEYRINNLQKSMGVINESFAFFEEKVPVFIAYIDSRDLSMPKIISGETAEKIKDRIKKCKRFILLATDGAVESKWCNWELGFADAIKGKKSCTFSYEREGE